MGPNRRMFYFDIDYRLEQEKALCQEGFRKIIQLLKVFYKLRFIFNIYSLDISDIGF